MDRMVTTQQADDSRRGHGMNDDGLTEATKSPMFGRVIPMNDST